VCFSNDTHNLLNYATLGIQNKEIEKAFTLRLAQNFSTLLVPTFWVTIIATVYRIIEYIATD
jgi:hypothetical protein